MASETLVKNERGADLNQLHNRRYYGKQDEQGVEQRWVAAAESVKPRANAALLCAPRLDKHAASPALDDRSMSILSRRAPELNSERRLRQPRFFLTANG
jgi:hypothetical protein